MWRDLDIGREIGVTYECIGVILALGGVSLLIASNRIKEGGSGISVVDLAAVANQCKVNEEEGKESGGPWPDPKPAYQSAKPHSIAALGYKVYVSTVCAVRKFVNVRNVRDRVAVDAVRAVTSSG